MAYDHPANVVVIESFDPTGPLLAEHALVTACIAASLAAQPRDGPYLPVALGSFLEGKRILRSDSASAARIAIASVAQAQHWKRQANRVRDTLRAEEALGHLHPWSAEWSHPQVKHVQAVGIAGALLRRDLPFTEENMLALLTWCGGHEQHETMLAPVAAIAKAAERYLARSPRSADLRAALEAFATRLGASWDKKSKRLAVDVARLYAGTGDEPRPDATPGNLTPAAAAPGRTVAIAPAGDPRVHQLLKHTLGLRDATPTADAFVAGDDRYAMPEDSPLRAEHEQLSALFAGYIERVGYHDPDLKETDAGRAILAATPAAQSRLLLAAGERVVAGNLVGSDYSDHRIWQTRAAAVGVLRQLAMLDVPLDRDALFDMLLLTAALCDYGAGALTLRIDDWTATAARFDAGSPLTDGERYVLHLVRLASVGGPPLGAPEERVRKLTDFIGDRANFWAVPGEAWADAANAEISAMPRDRQAAWTPLFRHVFTATTARPTPKWLNVGGALVDAIGRADVAAAVERWLPLVARPRTARRLATATAGGDFYMNDANATALRGLLWLAPTLPGDLVHAIAAVTSSAYRKVPGIGPRAVKVGNAAVYALSAIGTESAVGQLALLKVKVKFGTAQKEIEKAFDAAAAKRALPRDEIAELVLRSYGMDAVGVRHETFGEGDGAVAATLSVDGKDVALAWTRADGKAIKSVPAKVKAAFKDELKELQLAAKDAAAMVAAQADRIDGLFLAQRTWPLAAWRERYLDHPLVGTVARRLIWLVNGAAVAWRVDALVDVGDRVVAVSGDARVELWHPIGRPEAEVLAWRAWLARHEVRQPFKQAHREVYLLTDAERRTNTYSNRFAAHVLRQHQFNALCAARGWRNKLRLMVDDTYPPATRSLPQWNLRAEYWIEGVGDAYGTDTTESGAYLRLATDQVRFHRIDAATSAAHAGGGGYTVRAAGPGAGDVNEPLPLDAIPPLVLSEVLRAVDLFVGVASVGNDPTWADGGPDGRHQAYWQRYSFGDLTETARTRRAALESLLPRLTKLRDRWTLDDKFLVVRGSLRTYKIHLGSGNILMEPNDQYLCIVADRSTAKTDGVLLPFEGDATLSIILSKAFLLADDARIIDATITRQIAR